MERTRFRPRSRARSKTNTKALAEVIDVFGEVRDEIKRLKKEDSKLSKELKESLIPNKTVKGNVYKVTLYEKSRRTLDPAKVLEALQRTCKTKKEALKVFLSICNVSFSNAAEVLPASVINELEGEVLVYQELRYGKV